MTKRTFTMVPDELLARRDLSPLAKLVLSYIVRKQTQGKADELGVRAIAKAFGLRHKRPVLKALADLKACELLKVTPGENGQRAGYEVSGPHAQQNPVRIGGATVHENRRKPINGEARLKTQDRFRADVRRGMKDKGLNQTTLGIRAEMNPAVISAWLNRHRNFDLTTLNRVFAPLDLELHVGSKDV